MAEEKNPLEGVLKDIIKAMGGKGRLSEEEVISAWKGAVGESAAKHSRPASFKKSILIVNVNESSWLYELTLKKKDILKKLEGIPKGKKIKDIRFRIGDTKSEREKDKK